MRSPRSTPLPNNLFPMLSMLVGMIGALIVLLLAVTKLAQTSRDRLANAARRASTAANVAKLPERYRPRLPPSLPVFSDSLPAATALPDLPALVDRRPQLEAQIAELQTAIEKLAPQPTASANSGADLIQRQADLAETRSKLADLQARREAAQRRLSDLQAESERLDRDLREKRLQSKHVENRFAVVPYRGPNGTKRRPIYLECRRDAVILQPEGIAISAELLRDAGPDNVLSAVLAAAVEKLPTQEPDEKPYPLLLVRPDGIAGFYIVQRAILGAKYDSGFELMDGKVALAFGPPNAAVAEAVAAALKSCRGAEYGGFVQAGVGTGRAGGRGSLNTNEAAGVQKGTSSGFAGAPGATGAQSSNRPLVVGNPKTGPGAGFARPGPVDSALRSRRSGSAPFPSIASGASVAEKLADKDQVSPDRPNVAEAGVQRQAVGANSETTIPTDASSKSAAQSSDVAANAGAGPTVTFDQLLTANERPAPSPDDASAVNEAPDIVGIGVGFDRKPIRKEIAVVCRAQTLIIYPEGKPIEAGPDRPIAQVRLKLHESLRDARLGWGSPGPLFRWQPVFVFVVAPDGLETYYRLKLGWRNPPALIERPLSVAERADGFPGWR